KLDVSGNTIARWERGELEPEHPRMLWCALEYIRGQYISPQASAELAMRHQKLMAAFEPTNLDAALDLEVRQFKGRFNTYDVMERFRVSAPSLFEQFKSDSMEVARRLKMLAQGGRLKLIKEDPDDDSRNTYMEKWLWDWQQGREKERPS